MENEEKIMTDQDIIQEKKLNAELSARTLQATQVVDADQEENVHAESHDSQPVDAKQGEDVEPDVKPYSFQKADTDQKTEIQSQASPMVNAQAETASNTQPAQSVDALPETDTQPQTSQIVDALPERDAQPQTSPLVDAQTRIEAQSQDTQVVDTQPEGDTLSQSSQIVDADQTPQSEEDIPTVSFNSKLLKHNTEKFLSKIKSTKKKQSTQVVTADSVQAEEVPTIPIGSLQTISTLKPEVSVHSVASMRAVSMPAPLVAQPSEYRRSLGEWLEIWRDGIRPGYLPLSLMPVLLGSALAWTQTISTKTLLGHFNIVLFVLALVAAIVIQTGAHLINDYYDYQRGIDTSNVLGPGGLLQQGLIKPTRVLTIGLVLLILGAGIGLAAAFKAGPLTCLLGLIIVLCAYFFSATRKALSSLGLGELVGFLAFGLLPTMGAYMIQTNGHLIPQVVYYSLPLGFLAAATIYANNMRDIEGDSHVGKRTLATILGLHLSRILYSILMIAAYVVVLALGVPHAHPHFILIALWTLPGLVVAITGAMRTEISAGFHGVIRQTLKNYTLFTTLLIIGLILAAIIPALPKIPTNLITLP
jgi:1,4-dihydroxy-2-naphthoate octaprenyltransferase